MKLEEITAEEMFVYTIHSEYLVVLKKIKDAASKGITSILIDGEIDNVTRLLLEEKGFAVNRGWYKPASIFIGWENNNLQLDEFKEKLSKMNIKEQHLELFE